MWQFTQDNKWGCAHGELLWNLMKFQFLGGIVFLENKNYCNAWQN